MKKVCFNVKEDGFYGTYWPLKEKTEYAFIACIGDDANDYLARTVVKWLHKQGFNVLTMSPNKKDYGHHNYPLERIEMAIHYLKNYGNSKIGIIGASTTGTLALTVASMFKDISLTIALTPSDFIWQGFKQGKKDGCKEWPIKNESLFSYHGNPLPYMEFCYQHPEYWHVIEKESKIHGDIVNSCKLFDDSEKKNPLQEDMMIKVENIKGTLILIGAKDDALWNTDKYIHRMEERLSKKEHDCKVKTYVYEHGTHYVFPQSLIKLMLPIGSGFFVKLFFKKAREYPKQCLETRIDIDKKIKEDLKEWKNS